MKYKKRLGQNFLINKSALKKIVDALEIKKDDIVVEIGAGSGNLTSEIFRKTPFVIAVEKDKEWIEILKKRLGVFKNEWPKIIEADIRDVLEEISKTYKNYKIIGNIPYYLTGQLLRIFQKLRNPPQLIVLMLQKEVAQKILASPPNANLLSNIVNLWSKPRLVFNLKSKDFYPPPKVSSAVIKLEVLSTGKRLKNEEEIIELLKIAFKQPRKTLLNNLSSKFDKEKIRKILAELNLSEKLRPSELSLQLWITLAEKLNK
ncbi:MAG: 16S rRNA (adenine(1518)-N(6)/adenine(1519)-N(6))-dimethyltransferase RsmA [Patescibacteria group bacterium]|nr:16S rRNA (adenine(1518)-N(6)/adenine(1519)-N(6))-dimethyltransferase RsmA [Patescibacteria group bacterium]